jgi:magnesium chelatase family protein
MFSLHYQLLAAMNPCPCGYFGDTKQARKCADTVVTKYQKRICGPLLDRIDIHIEIPRVNYERPSEDRLGESIKNLRVPGI